MKIPMGGTMVLLVLLSGCTDADWQHATSFAGLGDAPLQAAPAPQPIVPVNDTTSSAPSSDAWCQTITRENATRDGLDDQTQRANFRRNYDQCVAIFSPGHQG